MLLSDFDGTLMDLAVDWRALREELGVSDIGELWKRNDPAPFERVTAVETQGARLGRDNSVAIEFVRRAGRFALISGNSEAAIQTFLARHADLRDRCAVVVGRESLAGPKLDREIFKRGVGMCLAALQLADAGRVTYLGDSHDELELARSLGFDAIDVATLARETV